MALRVPQAIRLDTYVWLTILPYHALLGWPTENTAQHFFLEIFGLAVLREVTQRIFVKSGSSFSDWLLGVLFSFVVFSILGLGVWLIGIGSAWVIVGAYAILTLTVREPMPPDGERIVIHQWESAQQKVGNVNVGLWRSKSESQLIFSLGGHRPAVVVSEQFFAQDLSIREFLFFHELGHLTLGHFRQLGYYNIGLYTTLIVLSISATVIWDFKYLGSGHWLPLGHCMLCGMVMTWLGWFILMIESDLRLHLEAEADRFAVEKTADLATALRFLQSCAEHPLEIGASKLNGLRSPAVRRLERLRDHTGRPC